MYTVSRMQQMVQIRKNNIISRLTYFFEFLENVLFAALGVESPRGGAIISHSKALALSDQPWLSSAVIKVIDERGGDLNPFLHV